ncbi:MAG: hypothetical protein ACRENJ_03695 [Candidatus Eiseniibacteriota bacterium]
MVARGLAAGLLLPLALAMTPGAAAGQAPGTMTSGDRVRIRLAQPGAAWRTGRLVRLTRDSLVFVTPDGRDQRALAQAAVARFQMSRGWRSRARTGALIGGVAAAGATVALGFAVGTDFEVDPGALAAASLFFGAGGALVGALVGRQFSAERWVDVPRPWASLGTSRGHPGLEVRFAWAW